ncbi:MAG TPA: FtsW/RodA/SpoVE family cell cycle protein [Verrucomicrobiae bacterium]|jgi:rod shape determining protein RodA|nr:FtsW/RodA/SpoVE family cell cycle protein [Verrucomicrobiae bacterium]
MFDVINNAQQSRVDKLQLAALAGLMFVGVAFVYSATMIGETASSLPIYDQLWFRQIIWYGLGAVGAVVLCLMDYRSLARWSFVVYWLTIVLLMAVLIPGIGSVRFGARRWFDLHVFQLQPSEFAKLALILALAHFLSRPPDELRLPGNFWKSIGLMVLPFVLILKEPDLGSALVLIPTGLAMMFVAGTPRRYLLRLIGGVGLIGLLLLGDVLFAPPHLRIPIQEYQRQRLLVYFGTSFANANASTEEKAKARLTEMEKSYQVRQALIAVGDGGFWGRGWRQGKQTALQFLPPGAAHNDFIFSVIAEEKGFVGSVVVLMLYAVVLFTGIRIAGQARDRLGKMIAVGVVTLIFSHVFINIGMNIRIVPVTGIPLPLLSYGGSSVLGSLIALGMLQNVYMYRKVY